jgi:hypothetical protein
VTRSLGSDAENVERMRAGPGPTQTFDPLCPFAKNEKEKPSENPLYRPPSADRSAIEE